MNADSKEQTATGQGARPAGAEQRLKEPGIKLPAPPEPFGNYVEAVQTGSWPCHLTTQRVSNVTP